MTTKEIQSPSVEAVRVPEPTIGAGLIVRNAETTIEACILSILPHVDQIVIVLAGESTDKTAKIVKSLQDGEYGGRIEVYDFDWIDDFAAARNFSFSHLKTDWYLWIDADDRVEGAEKLRILAQNAPDEVGGIWFPYNYSQDEFGNPCTLYERERLVRASCQWVWQNRLHETLSPLAPCVYVRSKEVMVIHNHGNDGTTRSDRNMKILNLMYEEDPEDKRVWLYLGHQWFASGDAHQAAHWYMKFGMDEGTVPIERYQALCYATKAMRGLQDRQAIEVALLAYELFPQYRDACCELASGYFMVGDYDKAIFWTNNMFKSQMMEETPAIIFINPMDYSFNAYALMSECYLKKGDIDESISWAQKAQVVAPTEGIANHIAALSEMQSKEKIRKGLMGMAVELYRNREFAKMQPFLDSCPFWFRDTPDFKKIVIGMAKYQAEIKDEPGIAVKDKRTVVVNIGNAVDAKATIDGLAEKYQNVEVISPLPTEGSKQINAYGMSDIEQMVCATPGRRVMDLRMDIKTRRIICNFNHQPADKMVMAMFLGQGLEHWSPQTIVEQGCGGSETSAAWVCREFSKRGCQPFLYAMDNGVWDGVIYRNFQSFNPESLMCNLFISSRVPQVFDAPINATQKWLWVHDIHCWDNLTPGRAGKLDAIIALSHWHAHHLKRAYPWLKEAQVIDLDGNVPTYKDNWTPNVYESEEKPDRLPVIAIIGDAMDTSRFTTVVGERNPHRFIWCSSPDRGLEQVLTYWPEIRKQMPDAELKIFYGWDYFDRFVNAIPAMAEFKQKLLGLLEQEGVEWMGRVGQDQLATELMASGIMLYPPPHDFRETYGIAFLEAQAAGVICFYRQNGALGETVGNRGIALDNDMTGEQIALKIRETIDNETLCGTLRREARDYAMKRRWEGQVSKMLRLYKRLGGGNGRDKNINNPTSSAQLP